MNFIFPKNYDFSFKFLGIFSYSAIFINVCWAIFLHFIISLFLSSFIVKLYVFIICFLPFFLFSILNVSNESIFCVLFFLFKYILRPKVFFYDKRF